MLVGGRFHTPLEISVCHGASERWSGWFLMWEVQRMLMLDMFGSENFIWAALTPTNIYRKRSSYFIAEKYGLFSETYHELHGSDLSVRPHSGHLKARVDESAVSKKPVTTNFWFTFYSMIVPFHVITRSECKVWSIKPQLHSHRQNWIYLYLKLNLTIFRGAEFRLMKTDFFSWSSRCVKSCLVNFLRLDWITCQ